MNQFKHTPPKENVSQQPMQSVLEDETLADIANKRADKDKEEASRMVLHEKGDLLSVAENGDNTTFARISQDGETLLIDDVRTELARGGSMELPIRCLIAEAKRRGLKKTTMTLSDEGAPGLAEKICGPGNVEYILVIRDSSDEEENGIYDITLQEAKQELAQGKVYGWEFIASVDLDLIPEDESLLLPVEEFKSRKQEEKESFDKYGAYVGQVLGSEATRSELERMQSEDDKEKAIGLVLRYLTVHKDGYGVEKFIGRMHECSFNYSHDVSHNNALILSSVAERLGLGDLQDVESKRALYEYFKKEYHENGFYFHGFNGTFAEDIAKNGLRPDQRAWDWQDLNRITEIGSKAGRSMILGWAGLNSKGKTSYSATSDNTYRYAVASPEWFAQFCCEGHHIPYDPANPDTKTAFYRRDYDMAKQNVMSFCDSMMSSSKEDIAAKRAYPNITLDEKVEILSFFEKYWERLAGPESGPKCAVIKRGAIGSHELPDTLDEFCEMFGDDISKVDVVKLLGGFWDDTLVDAQTEDVIPADKLTVVNLPDYNIVHLRKSA